MPAPDRSIPPPLPPPADVSLYQSPEFPCPYLANYTAKTRACLADGMTAKMYQEFMDAGFRRSGRIIYQPVCATCRQCIPIRIRVDQFAPTPSQRRCARRNLDLTVEAASPAPTAEKFRLYQRYLLGRHRAAEPSIDDFVDFLYSSPITTIEFTYRTANGLLAAVGLCDVSSEALSTVYFYFDPEERRRSLGTFGVLEEIRYACSREIAYYYLGYWVRACDSMRYKSDFGPHELLQADGSWRAVERRKTLA